MTGWVGDLMTRWLGEWVDYHQKNWSLVVVTPYKMLAIYGELIVDEENERDFKRVGEYVLPLGIYINVEVCEK